MNNLKTELKRILESNYYSIKDELVDVIWSSDIEYKYKLILSSIIKNTNQEKVIKSFKDLIDNLDN